MLNKKIFTLSFLVILMLNACSGSSGVSENLENESVDTDELVDNDDTSIQDDDTPKDITNAILTSRSANCADYVRSYFSNVTDIKNSAAMMGDLKIEIVGEKCVFSTNNIPNHDFNDATAHFATPVSEQVLSLEITTSPVSTGTNLAISLETDNAVMLNGVKLDLLAAACYGVGDGKIGCNDMSTPWRFDPMSPLNNFGTDAHNAHTQPSGAYHYHGSPMALFDTDGNVESPVIGFAADGFPVFGSYIEDAGSVRSVASSYRLKSGSREDINGVNPGGQYDGTYRDDYEYVAGLGDLDECNGMTRDGVYGYYVTQVFPYILSCYKGSVDASFNKR